MPSRTEKLTDWSRRLARDLPWRGTRDPYRIWIGEIMLQQTRVETVIPYYRRFLKRFPTVKSLADSSLEAVLRVWEGLGYYSRARNLRRAAVRIRAAKGGRLPRKAAEWERLPGVGRYTAAAIAAIAFDEPAIALDSNARRILARFYAYRRGVRDERAQRDLAERFRTFRGAQAPGAFFQALMDLGQLVCLPRRPLCPKCPIADVCKGYRLGLQNRLPAGRKAVRIPHYDIAAAVIRRAGKVLLARRPEGRMLGGMWEFPGGKVERGEGLASCLRRELREELDVRVCVREKILALNHAYSHFRVTLHVFRCDGLRGRPKPLDAAEVRWVGISRLHRYPMGKIDRATANAVAGAISKP